jgi:succinyl-CoA synthetase beta subunit
MDLMEYQVRDLFSRSGIPVNKAIVIDSLVDLEAKAAALAFPLVVKAQVQTGGRGKAGGIRFVSDQAELRSACQDILGMTIRGHLARRLMIVEKAEVSCEWYLSIILDRISKSPAVIFSPLGGMEIEETARKKPDQVLKVVLDPLIGVREYLSRYLISKCNLAPEALEQLDGLVKNLYALFCSHDCTLVEINPLAMLANGCLAALDAKMTVDDSALFRQPEIRACRDELLEPEQVLEARKFNFFFIPCDPDGSIAVMSNGSGLIMSCIDLISKQGMKVKAALDLGGGATCDRIREAIRIVLSDPGIKALFINIFGGITRCDEVAGGVKMAIDGQNDARILVVRFEGTNRERGMEILATLGGQVFPATGLEDGVQILSARRDRL